MFSQSFDIILAIAGIVIGILMVTGHGEMFMRGGNAKVRKQLYDEKKMEKVCGVSLILIGIVTGIDAFTTTPAAKFAYVIALLVIFVGMILVLQKKCKK
jgi:hypothetical protein